MTCRPDIFRIILIAVCSVCHAVLSAQSVAEPMRHLQIDNGLSSNHTTCFHQDFQGFMWIGTNEGLCRFDGIHFYNYFQNPKDPERSLSGNWINDLCAHDQYLFIATNHGISVFNIERQEFCNDFFTDERFNYKSRELFNFIVPINNKWYVGGENSLFELHDDFSIASDLSAMMKHHSQASLRDFLVPTVNEKGHLLFACCGDMFEYRPLAKEMRISSDEEFNYPKLASGSCHTATPHITEHETWYFPWGSNPIVMSSGGAKEVKLRSNNPVYDGSTNHCFQDHQNNLWFATESGLFRFLLDGMVQEIQLESGTILSCFRVFQDKLHNLWIATSNGVYYTADSNSNWTITSLPRINTDKKVYAEDMAWWQNSLWLNTNESSNSCVYQLNRGEFWPFSVGGLEKGIRSIYPWDDEHLFIGGWKYAAFLNAADYAATPADVIPEEFREYPIIKTLRDKHHNTWLSFGQYNGILRISADGKPVHFVRSDQPGELKRSLPISSAYDMAEDHEGMIWMVRSKLDGKLICWNPNTDRFDEIHPVNPEAAGMNYNGESYCVVAHEDAIWFAVMREGLFRYDKKTNTIEQFTRNDGLLSNDIYALEVDKNGVVWMGTAQGLAAMSYPGKTVTHFTASSGLPDQNFSSASLFVEAIDRMFFSTHGSLVSFSPKELLRPAVIPELFLTGLRVEGKESGILSRQFDANENHIDFMFTAVDLYHAEGFEYRYRLEGLESDWNEAGKNKMASYANIPAGDYSLLVCVKTLGEWSEPKTLYQFHIARYFYKTWWFITLLASMFCLAVYGIYLMRIRRLKHLESIRNRISRDLHDDIGSALSSIRILSGQRKSGDEHDQEIFRRINRSSQQMLDNMDDIIWAIQPENDLGEQLLIRMREFASEVVEAAGMSCHLQLDERIEHRHFGINQKRNVYLIFKEAVNNAFKYSKGSEVKIRFHMLNSGKLELEVTDDGVGFETSENLQGNGLRNMQRRADELHGVLKIVSGKNHGTTINLQFEFD